MFSHFFWFSFQSHFWQVWLQAGRQGLLQHRRRHAGCLRIPVRLPAHVQGRRDLHRTQLSAQIPRRSRNSHGMVLSTRDSHEGFPRQCENMSMPRERETLSFFSVGNLSLIFSLSGCKSDVLDPDLLRSWLHVRD